MTLRAAVRTISLRGMCAGGVVGVLLLVLVSHAAADQFPRQPGIKILKYDFDVSLGDSSDEVQVNETVDLQFAADGVSSLDLNLCNLIRQSPPPDPLNPCLIPAPRAPRGSTAPPPPAPSSVGRGMTVTSVVVDGNAAQYQHADDRVHISFAQPSKAGERAAVALSYHGIPATGLFIGKNKYGERVFFTDNWPNKARNWLATIDHISVKAPKTISVTAPRKYQVISNGRLREQVDLPGDLRRTVWEEAQPIPSWQFSLGVAQMAVDYFGGEGDVPFSAWLFPQDWQARKEIAEETASVFEFYRDHIGPYLYEKLAHVEATGAGGATEPATTIFYYGGFGPLSHEMAHQWFGDAITESDWDHVWLSEGFATYFALLYTEHQQGHDAFLAGVERTREVATRYALAHPSDTVIHPDLARDSEVFSNAPQIYQGGAMVLHTLRGVLGDQNFWAGIRLYYSRFANRSATSNDFRHAMEDACHAASDCPREGQDLAWFFDEWLRRGGILQLKGGWHYDAEAKQLRITLDQIQPQGTYRMPLQVGVEMPPGGTTTAAAQARGPQMQIKTVWIDKAHNEVEIPLDSAPLQVQLDPGRWVPLMQASFVAE